MTDAHDWTVDNIHSTPDYHWLSDQEVLFAHDTGDGADEVYRFFRRNLVTRVDTELPLLAKEFNQTPGTELQLSPDRKRLLWCSPYYEDADGGEYDYILVASLDGSALHEWPLGVVSFANYDWMPDSQRWFVLRADTTSKIYRSLITYAVQAPYRKQTIQLVQPMQAPYQGWAYVTPTQHLILLDEGDFSTSPSTNVHISDTDLESSGAKTCQFTIHLPPNTVGVDGAEISPQGDRIAWLLDCEHVSWFSALLHRLHASFQVTTQPTEEIWVSHLDGSQMHEIGHIPARPREQYGVEIEGLHWLPDGKKLSFLYKDALWTVPAD
jgi:hypothetical protein